MASSAAVATGLTQEELPDHEVNEELGTEVTFTKTDRFRSPGSQSAHGSDDDEDVTSRSRRRPEVDGKADEQEGHDQEEEVDEDLFGDAAEEEKPQKRSRHLDDEDIDSGDDLDRDDRRVGDEETQEQNVVRDEVTAVDIDLGRHSIPAPSDGELYLMKVPKFLSMQPHQFTPQTFQPPVTDHHSTGEPSATFSAHKTAMTAIRWRQSPSDPKQLQTNARVVRWSNGELTLQFASDPSTHYPITGNALAPSQRGPSKPTPTSKAGPKRPYAASEDQYTYLAAPQEMAGLLRITNKLTTGLKVESATDASDEALERLQHSLATATRKTDDSSGGISMLRITEDPELAKRKAEIAEKDKQKAQKRREAAEMRDRERQGRAFGRRGMGTGLTVGSLEDDDELGKGITRLPTVGKKKQRRNQRGEIYSEDEDEFSNRRRTREDEYDEEDDFVAGSDEEEEAVEEDEDEDEAMADEPTQRPERPSPKQSAPESNDAEGDLDDQPPDAPAAGSPQGRKRRRVIEEDDDE